MSYYKGYKVRLLPTPEQEKYLFEIANAYRCVWNWALDIQILHYKTYNYLMKWNDLRLKFLAHTKTSNGLWFRKYPIKYLVYAIRDLQHAYERFFILQKEHPGFSSKVLKQCEKQNREPECYEMYGHPNFKSKDDYKISFCTAPDNSYFKYNKYTNKLLGYQMQKVKNNYITIKMPNFSIPSGKRLDQIKMIHDPRVVYENGKWTINYVLEHDNQVTQLNNFNMGIDLGTRKLAVVAYGANQIRIYKNINWSDKIKHLERNLKHHQQNRNRKYNVNNKKDPNHKYVQTKGVKDETRKIQKLNRKLHNIRIDYINKIIYELVSLKPKCIVLEDLDIQSLLQSKTKNKVQKNNIKNAMWFEFRDRLQRKCEYYGIQFKLADRWYPSSKICSNCNTINKSFDKEKIYMCDKCGMIIDRDVNAAKNLKSLA